MKSSSYLYHAQALASVLSVAAQMKEAMEDLEEGSARSQVPPGRWSGQVLQWGYLESAWLSGQF